MVNIAKTEATGRHHQELHYMVRGAAWNAFIHRVTRNQLLFDKPQRNTQQKR